MFCVLFLLLYNFAQVYRPMPPCGILTAINKYHIVSYRILSYIIISHHIPYYHIPYHIIYTISYIISHHITSYRIIYHVSYHIIHINYCFLQYGNSAILGLLRNHCSFPDRVWIFFLSAHLTGCGTKSFNLRRFFIPTKTKARALMVRLASSLRV